MVIEADKESFIFKENFIGEGINKFTSELFVYETNFFSVITENQGQINNSSRKVDFGVIPQNNGKIVNYFQYFFVIMQIQACFC